MIEASGVTVARQSIEFATLGQIRIAPNKTTMARMSAFSMGHPDQIGTDGSTGMYGVSFEFTDFGGWCSNRQFGLILLKNSDFRKLQ